MTEQLNIESEGSIRNYWHIIENEIRFETKKASGHGGQHLQATQSAVTLRWSIW